MKLSTSTEWLYFHLWKKNPDTNTSCPGVFLVDTVIYRWAQPYFWYFTNREGQIIRKTKERIESDNLKASFKYNTEQTDITALYLTSQDVQITQKADFKSTNSTQSEQEVILFEYFDNEQFDIFL